MMFDNLLRYGLLMKINKAIITDMNIKIGKANIGSAENIPIRIQYSIFLKYLINIKATPNLFVFYIPL